MAQKNLAEEAIIAFLGTLSKLAQSSERYMVRDAGAIAPLVALMISGTGEVPARAASVLRDLAQYAANRTAILEAGGIAQLVQMLSTAASSDSTVAVEAADALRSLCEGNLAVCAAVREQGGVKALVAQLKGGHTSQAASVAVAALSQMILADAESRRQIVEQGGVKRLVALLSGGVASDGGGARKRGQEAVNWCETKACEETARAVHELAAEPGCSALLLSAGAVPSLVMLIMRAGAHATSSQLAAAVLVSLLKADDADETALNAVIATLVDAQRTDSFSGHGWSRERGIFTELRSMLHAAAERRLQAVEEGQSAAAIQQAIEVGRAVELPAERLDGARATFDDMQAKRRREKMASASEERRIRKEEEAALRAAKAAAAAPAAEDDAAKKTLRRRKDPVPSRYVKKGTLGDAARRMAEAAEGEGGGQDAVQQQLDAELATLAAMQHMTATMRERMVRRMEREGYFEGMGRIGLLAAYAQILGVLEMTPREDGSATPTAGDAASEAAFWTSIGFGAVSQVEAADPRRREERDNLAQKAFARRLAQHQEAFALAYGDGGDGGDSDDESFTGSSYSGSTIGDDDDEYADGDGGGARGGGGSRRGTDGDKRRGSWFGGIFPTLGSARGKGGSGTGGGEEGGKRHRRRHKRRRHKKKDGGVAAAAAGAMAATPTFMLPLFSRLQQQALAGKAQGQALAGDLAGGHVEKWRKRWDEKWNGGAQVGSPRSGSLGSAEPVPSAASTTRAPDLRSTLGELRSSLGAPAAHSGWGVVRERLHEVIRQSELEA